MFLRIARILALKFGGIAGVLAFNFNAFGLLRQPSE
jgi:hypothetical protein